MVETKQVPSKLCFCATTVLTMPEIQAFAQANVEKLILEAKALGLEAAGPLEFLYEGVDGTPTKQFELTIALPIAARKGSSGMFQYIETKPATCVFALYQGGMSGIGQAWGQFMKDLHDSGVQTTQDCREIYKQWIAPESNDNITELQASVAG